MRDKPPQLPWKPGQKEAWRVERYIRRPPAHYGEAGSNRWLTLLGVGGLIALVVGIAFLLWPDRPVAEELDQSTPIANSQPTAVPQVTLTPIRVPSPAPPTATRPRLTATAVPRPTLTIPPTPATRTYKVQQGDTLLSIAAKFKVTVQSIQAANGMQGDFLHAGDDLVIPLPTRAP